MSYETYMFYQQLVMDEYPFDALIMAAIKKADGTDHFLLCKAFSHIFAELALRSNTKNGLLPGEKLQEKLL